MEGWGVGLIYDKHKGLKWNEKVSRRCIYVNDVWENRKETVGEGKEGDMKGDRGSMRARGKLGLIQPRGVETTTCHVMYMTTGV